MEMYKLLICTVLLVSSVSTSSAQTPVTCGVEPSVITCPANQQCCGDSCCNKSPPVAGIFVALVAVCMVMTIVGICLYLKNKVHKDTVYTVDDLESLHSRQLKKQVSFGDATELCATPALNEDGLPMIPGTPIFNECGELADLPVEEAVDVATDTASTQVTSAKRTVVTVNLNMKEKENIKLNIFMNKDNTADVEPPQEESFPRGLTAKESAKKKASVGKKASTPVKGKSPAKAKAAPKASAKKKGSKK